MVVNSMSKAWEMARIIFPTDFEFDEMASERAGYNIYSSTAEGNHEWISSLGNALELNMKKGSIRINVVEEKPVTMTACVRSLTRSFPDYTIRNVFSVTYVNDTFLVLTTHKGEVNTHTFKNNEVSVTINA